MGATSYKRYKLPDMRGAEILLKETSKDPDFVAVAYVKVPGAAMRYLPDGLYHEHVSDVEKYRAWAFHAERNISSPEVFSRCTQNMNMLSTKIAR